MTLIKKEGPSQMDVVTATASVSDQDSTKDVSPATKDSHTSPADPTEAGLRLYDHGGMVLVPTPTSDPKDPLNLAVWHKCMIIFLVGSYSAFSVLGTSGLSAVYPSLIQAYPNESPARISDLLTYPTLFMGIGNLFSMPLCVTVGRRPVFLFSLLMLIVTGFWCAFSDSLGSHVAGRSFFSMAAGQSEALAPYIVEEVHFLHERSTKLSWFIGVQTVGTAAMFVATTYIVPSMGIKWWYLIITFVNVALLLLSYLFVVETKYERVEATDGAIVHLNFAEADDSRDSESGAVRNGLRLRPDIHGPRTWQHDLRLFHFKPVWSETFTFYKDTFKSLAIPSILWLLLLNGAFLGIYVYQASTFAQVLMSPPYLFKFAYLGWVQLVQILDCVLLVPVLGYGTDLLAKVMCRWRKGVFQPEYRLISMSIPGIAAVIGCVIYGQAAAHPTQWSWMGVVAPYHLGYFAFLGANLVSITYAIDSFPRKAGPVLLVICAGRGFISFGLSYSTVPLISKTGYDGAMNIFAIISGVLAGIAVPMYFLGTRFRLWAMQRLWPKLNQ
ncbi:related to HOL1 protein [Moesziomyces antarcticus]|uniref:Related to HOL1 protein n=2 Tax=Pseudozyma antarctica TaxID=84753 RepID=A0A5C3FHZ5_PSEA2|nr:related to HOL1 protein [Moesziomyces antarcticus]